jgi:aspartate aminotransferase
MLKPSLVFDPVRLSSRAQRARPSLILGINARAKALIAGGRDVVLFGAGEPDFPTAPHIRQATTEAMERGQTKYTASSGVQELRDAVCQTLKRDLSLSYAPDEVIVTTGAKMALYELFQAVCDEGDEVILFGPYWSSYAEIVALAGATPVIVPTAAENGFQPDPERLRRALTARTRVVLLNSPGNPTGAVYDRATLEALATVIETTSALVVSDDIYDKIVFDGRRFSNLAQLSPSWRARTVVINGVSKAYSMTGFRIGWAAGPKPVIAAMGRIQDQSTSGPTSFAQAGALAALTGPQEFVAAMAREFEQRRDLIVAGLREIPGVTCSSPGGAFYVLPSVESLLRRRLEGRVIDSSSVLAEVLLDRFGVALVPGDPFGAPNHLRLSFATSTSEIQRGLGRLREGLLALS